MNREFAESRAFAGAIYFSAVVIIASNFLDLGANIWPWRPGAPEWRYGAIGLTGGFLLTPLMGILLAMIYAGARQDRAGMIVFTVPALVLGGIVLLLIPFFVLDSLQIRGGVNPDLLGPFYFGVTKALFKLLAAGVAMVWCGVVGITWFKAHAQARAGKNNAGREGLVVGK